MTSPLEETIATFQRWLYLPDTRPVVAILATIAANRIKGDPVWLLLIAPPGSGKTEILQATKDLPEVRSAAVITEASLLSAVPKKERSNGSKGGLLREIGGYGILMMKDFGTVLSMKHETRTALLAAFREIFDGGWVRHAGSDGGMHLTWTGKVGLVAGATPAIDHHHGVMSSLGERFCFYRMSVPDPEEQARRALTHHEAEAEMRQDLADAVSRLFDGLNLASRPEPSKDDIERLIKLSSFVVRCRSDVIRDGYDREVVLKSEAEAPGRLVNVLRKLLVGARAIGASDEVAWSIVEKTAFDSMPAQRLEAIRYCVLRDTEVTTSEVSIELGVPAGTTRRTLEDLAAHRVLLRRSEGAGRADNWRVSAWTVKTWAAIHAGRDTVPEKSTTPADGVVATDPKDGEVSGKVAAVDNGTVPENSLAPQKDDTLNSSPIKREKSGTLPHSPQEPPDSQGVPHSPAVLPDHPEGPERDDAGAWEMYGEDDIPF